MHENEYIASWHGSLTKLLTREMTTGFPLFALGAQYFRVAEVKSRNAELALLCAINACARAISTVSSFCPADGNKATDTDNFKGHSDSTAAGALLNRLRGQRWPPNRDTALACLSHTDLSSQNLVVQDLYQADLHEANLRGTSLVRAELSGADLSDADLSGANLTGADLGMATLARANLSSVRLRNARLHGVDLNGADLSEADLEGVNLRGVDLSGALNLTQIQLDKTWSDGETKLPEGLTVKRRSN
jgi:uncharacterized protein YjbI with pentapeptide repeats